MVANFQVHLPYKKQSSSKGGGVVPKGCLAIMVGHEGEEQQRFVVPVVYFNHPLFLRLLKEAEEEYGFDQKQGTITIPCHVEEFCHVRGLIDQDRSHHHHHHHHHYHRQRHQHRPVVGCFRA